MNTLSWSYAAIFCRNWFRCMTLGKILCLVVLIKLLIMFGILRPFFFPNFLNEHAPKDEKQEYVFRELVKRGNTDSVTK